MANKTIKFHRSNRIPGEVLDQKEDKFVQANTSVLVPSDYAEQLVRDGFAEYAAKKRGRKPKPTQAES